MPDALIPIYRILVYDPVSGAKLIDPLPHLHQSVLDVRAIQPGSVGAAAIGTFSTPLYPPGSDEWASASASYSQLAYGQRVEFYEGDVAGGDPKFSGYVTGLPSSLNNYTLTGVDSTWLASRARTDRNYSFNGTTDTLLKNSLKAYSMVYGDDTWTNLSAYTNNGTWTTTTDEGYFVGALAGTGGDGLLYTTASYTNAQYADCVIDSTFRIVCGGSFPNNAEAGIIAAVTDANNFTLARAFLTNTSSGVWRMDIQIFTKAAGVYTQRASVPWHLNLTSGTFRGQIRLFGSQSGGNYTWRATLNGHESIACTYTVAATPSGPIGFRSAKGGNAAGETAFMGQLYFANKASLFAQGTVTAGTNSINQKFSKTPLLDLWNIAATTEGCQWRKNPKAGLNADTVDYGVLGTDLTATVKIEEGVNLVEPSTIGPNAEIPATELEISAPAATTDSTQGTICWHNITAIRKFGVLSDTANVPYVADSLGQRAHVKAIADKRAAPGVAKSLTIIRDARYASATSPTGLLMRELDKVEVTSPRLGLFHQSVQILGYVINEGKAEMQLIGDQFPLLSRQGQELQLRRLWQTVDALANGTTSVTGGY